MGDPEDNVLDRAEIAARRLIERLGASLDRKTGSSNSQMLSPSAIGQLASKLERAIESNLKKEQKDSRPVAPNSFIVLLTYEESVQLGDHALQTLAVELKATADEFINNRRYSILGPLTLQVNRDLFVKSSLIKADFQSGAPASNQDHRPAPHGELTGATTALRTLRLSVAGHPDVRRLELSPGGAPACIGRAAGNALRVDDESVSRIHCSIVARGDGQLAISDLNSSNGTSVNGRLLDRNESRPLSCGDSIFVGEVELKVIEIV